MKERTKELFVREVMEGWAMRLQVARGVPVVVLAGCLLPGAASAQVLTARNAIWNFQGKPDGAIPLAEPAVDSKGNLFVTTSKGGAHNEGAVVELTPPADLQGTWSERVIYSFNATPGGAQPKGAVLVVSDTTLIGTASNSPSLWQLTSSDGGQTWTFSQLVDDPCCDFNGDVVPGPEGRLYTDARGILVEFLPPEPPATNWSQIVLGLPAFTSYGATGRIVVDHQGSIYGVCNDGGVGYGFAFKYIPAAKPGEGITQVLWEFGGLNDGAEPSGGLRLGPEGELYGTTTTGLGTDTFNGTIFRLAPPAPGGSLWSESVIAVPPTGEQVQGPVAFDRSGNVFATTADLLGSRQGEVFHAAPAGDGTYSTVVDGLLTRASGIAPASGVIWFHGVLYGTTQDGGSAGRGTVYAVRPR